MTSHVFWVSSGRRARSQSGSMVAGGGEDATKGGPASAHATTMRRGLDVFGPQGDRHPGQRLRVILAQDPVSDETAIAFDIQPSQVHVPEEMTKAPGDPA